MLRCGLVLCGLIVLGLSTAHAEVIDVDALTETIPIGRQVGVLEDPGGSLTIDDVTSPSRAGAFSASQNDTPSFGYTSSAYWVRIQLQGGSVSPKRVVLRLGYPLLDDVSFYVAGADGRWLEEHTGDLLPFSSRGIEHTDFCFGLAVRGAAEIYVRVRSDSSMKLPLLLSPHAVFTREATRRDVGYGIFFGILLAMVGYNFLLYLRLRASAYLIYCGYVFFMMASQSHLAGYGFRLVWDGAIGFQQWGIPILLATATFCGGRFAQVFLGTREKISSLHKPINIALGICAVAFVSPFVVPYRVSILLAIVAVAVTSIFAFVAGWLGVIRGVRQARFYVIAWTVFLFGTVAIGLVALGVLPSNQITENAYVLGCIIEVIFLSFALADNYKLIQEEALRIRAESERDLQIAVDERTSELVEQRNELVVLTGELKSANDNLVSHQAQLVEAEKMSSLGALISGVAHEMNTPLATIQAGLRNLNREFDRSESAISEQAAEVIEVSGDAAKRLAGIVAALRQYARDDRTETEVFDLVEIVHNSVAIAKGGVKSVPIVVSAPDSVTVAAFPAKLSQVLCNLIVNAGQACEDAAEPEIEVRVSDTEENVLIEVRDNGPGVPDEVVDKIFDPFFTTKDVGAGTGLGLAISKSFVEEMQGELSYRRDEGQTVFVVSLVVSPSDAGQEAAS